MPDPRSIIPTPAVGSPPSIVPTRTFVGEAVPRQYIVSRRRGDPLGRPRSFMPTRSFMPGTNKSRGMASLVVGDAGRRRIRARHASGIVGDAGRRRIRARHASGIVGDAGRRRIRARHGLAPTHTIRVPRYRDFLGRWKTEIPRCSWDGYSPRGHLRSQSPRQH